MAWIETNGVSLRYTLTGLPLLAANPVLVLLHEIGGSLESWDDCLPGLESDFTVLRYDQRGFGLSEKVVEMSIADCVADLLGLLDSLAISQPVCLAGSAMGAGIAIAFATTHPTRVKRMAISSPAIGGDLPPMALKGLQARIDAIETGGVRAVVDSSLDKSYPTELRHDLERFQGYRLRWLGNPPQAIIAISNMLRNMDLNPALPRITCPTLVIGCQQDTIRPAAESAAIAAMIPESTYREAASGHFMAIQTPELFVQIVSAFLLAA